MKSGIGMMQGRLTKPAGLGIQFFPWENWQNEFRTARELGLAEIEWIFDLENYEQNPLWTEAGQTEIKNLMAETGVKINFICADIFMRQPFVRTEEKTRALNVEILKKLIERTAEIGGLGVEIPCVDNSSIKTSAEEAALARSIQECLKNAEEKNILINLEMDYPAEKFLGILNHFNHPLVRANYDSGNSSGLGYSCAGEMAAYGPLISNVHIKDRLKGNGTVPLGTGSANFDELFSGLKQAGYQGNFILQAARGIEGQEAENIKNQIEFVRGYLKKYEFI